MFPCDLPPERSALPLVLTGGCHCGAVRFRVTLRTYAASACNCSLCTKKAYVHLIVPKEDFTLLTDRDGLGTYRFNTGVAAHHFCRTCGVHSFYVPQK